MKKRITRILLFIFLIFGMMPSVSAGNLSVWASSTTVTVGNTVTISVKAEGLAGRFSVSSSDGNILSGGSGGEWIENSTATFKFSTKNPGTATITVRPDNAADFNGSKYTASKSITINVVKPREKSDNNNLKFLSVENYELSPEFNKDTLEYTVNIDTYVENIKINATKEDGYASLEGAGEKEVFEGANKFEVKVTSETGKEKTYTLNVFVKDNNPIKQKVDNQNYTVVKRGAMLPKPIADSDESFTETTVVMNDTEIPAFYNEKTKMTLVGLTDEKGNTGLYIYSKKENTFSKFESLTSRTKTIIFQNKEIEDKNFIKTTVTIHNQKYQAYQNKNNKDYVLIYGIDLDTGKENWYLYHIKEESLQIYMKDIIQNMETNFHNKIEQYHMMILAIAGVAMLLLVVMVIQIRSKSKLKKELLDRLQLMEEEISELETKEKPVKKKATLKEEDKEKSKVKKAKEENN